MSSASMGKEVVFAQELERRKRARLDKLTELNAIHSPLLRLPAEIRDMIYVYVFRDEVFRLEKKSNLDIEEWLLSGGVRPAPNATDLHTQKYPGMALLLASRQTHHEAALHPYKLAIFDFGVSITSAYRKVGPKEMVMKSFLKDRTMAQAEMLGRMQVCMGGGLFDIQIQKARGNKKMEGMWTGDAAYWAAELGCQEYFS
ncbi:hypothetical protein J4E93_004094 [Alternaria ventricosa]|uniref:uncharacterized protein n=1 Tax=Alternaria ventricosa TaxID=1187951 RepID=UPI0020C466DE|nr:uncharacterized protein J4E93_004094 [Alternaria ventricosa]KAI4647684.1 hypothetical protein J4E93_004094 [Alternaria ventricosa]